MGQGKSGSTILGVALGNCDEVFFAGELCNWLMSSGRPLLGGRERVRFWKGVRDDVDGAEELFGIETYRRFERGLSLFRPDRWRGAARLRQRYQHVTAGLYRAIAERAHATHIVDSSHLPLRARELQRNDGIDMYLIFLVRDVEGVVASHARDVKRHDIAERRRLFLSTNIRMWWAYLLASVVFLRQPEQRRLLIRHEDFVADPAGVLQAVLDFAGSPGKLPDLSTLSTGIPLTGNPLLRSDTVAVAPRPAPPLRQSRLMRLAQRPWAAVVGLLQPVATGAKADRDGHKSP